MNIFRLFQRWIKALDSNAISSRAVQKRRKAWSNSTPPAPSVPPGARPVSTGTGEAKSHPPEDTSTTAVTSLRWVKYGETAVVAGRNIGGMVYLGPGGGNRVFDTLGRPIADRPVIVPTLPVARSGPDMAGDGMPYWPGYRDISPHARAAYLDWLATGRSNRRYGVGHIFLYFYGLVPFQVNRDG